MKSVLIVEDELIVAASYKVFLQQRDMGVCQIVSTEQEAAEAFAKHKPDIVMLDLRLKHDDSGVSVAKYIRKQSQVPIIFTTGNPISLAEQELSTISNSVILNKPINNQLLLETINKLTGGK